MLICTKLIPIEHHFTSRTGLKNEHEFAREHHIKEKDTWPSVSFTNGNKIAILDSCCMSMMRYKNSINCSFQPKFPALGCAVNNRCVLYYSRVFNMTFIRKLMFVLQPCLRNKKSPTLSTPTTNLSSEYATNIYATKFPITSPPHLAVKTPDRL